MPLRRCLIVSPHFPPSTVAGVHRARHLAKHLPTHGWRPTIVCVDPRYHAERLDPELARLVPSSVDVVPVGAVPAGLTRLFGVSGDIGLRGFLHIRNAIVREMARERPHVVLITGSPYYPMLLGGWIRRRWGVPVILDFQDPWASKEGATHRRWSKRGIAHQLAVALEPRALRAACAITSVSPGQNAEMRSRYPWLAETQMAAIPIGGDPDDFKACSKRAEWHGSEALRVTFSYVGTAMPRSTPLFQTLLHGLAALREKNPAVADRIVFRFVGTSNQPNPTASLRIQPLASAAALTELVIEEPARVPFVEAIEILAKTDAVLMIGSDEPHYTASKIYPAMMCGRPYLSLFHRASSAHAILTKAGGGVALSFDSHMELQTLVPTIRDALERLAIDPGSFGYVNPSAYEQYTATAVAKHFAELFDWASAQSSH